MKSASKRRPRVNKKSKGKQRLSKAKKTEGKPAKTSNESWYCFMSEENVRERMICCRACERWPYVECAEVDDDLFVCEACESKIND